jgi:outer membrane protein insertion porin family
MTNRICFVALLLITILIVSTSIAEAQDERVKRPAIRKRAEQAEEPAYKNDGRKIVVLEFRGNEKFSSGTILEFMKYSRQGGSYYKERLENDLQRVRALLYADRGYLRAQFGEPEIEETNEGLRIVIPVEEGLRYRYGEINVEDATLLSSDEVIGIIGAKSGEIIKGYSGVQKGLERLKSFYANRGYIQFTAIPRIDYRPTSPDSQEGIADVTFEIEEGIMYFIRRIEFTGNLTVSDAEIWSKLRLNIGDVFNQDALDAALRRLNEWGRFEKIFEEDCTFNTNEQPRTLDILIKLKEKHQ